MHDLVSETERSTEQTTEPRLAQQRVPASEPYLAPPLEIETVRGLVPETALAMDQTTGPRLVQQWELVSAPASAPYSDPPLVTAMAHD